MIAHTVSDSIIRIKNATLARRKAVILSHAKIVKAMADILVKQGYLLNVKEELIDGKKVYVSEIAYHKRLPLLTDVLIVSKPSLRVYVRAKDLVKNKRRGSEISVLSTSLGIMTEHEAAKKAVGGELLFKIW